MILLFWGGFPILRKKVKYVKKRWDLKKYIKERKAHKIITAKKSEAGIQFTPEVNLIDFFFQPNISFRQK